MSANVVVSTVPPGKFHSMATGRELYDESMRRLERRDYEGAQIYALLAQTHFLGEIAGLLTQHPHIVSTGTLNGAS